MICKKCNENFPYRIIINGKQKNLCHRKLCLKCNPFKSGVRGGNISQTITLNCICKKCGKQFNYKAGCGYTKKKCSVCSTNDRREKIRKFAIEYKGGKCCKCGYNRCLTALDFHHRDETKKKFTIAGNYTRSWLILKEEIDKCDLLCSNCHREFHAGR